MNKIKRLALLLFILVAIFVAFRLYIDNNFFEITNYEIELSNEKFSFLKNKKIIQLSDLHNKMFGNNNEDLILAIDSIKPDYIFLTGDMVSAEDTGFEGFSSLIEKIGNKYNCYYILGNHEYDIKNERHRLYNEFISKIEQYGVIFLDNKKVVLAPGINLYGLDYDDIYYQKIKYSATKMETTLGKASKDEYNILITHNPFDFNSYARWGANLVFTGHTHGGMIRVLNYGIVSPNRELFPKFDGDEIYESDEYDSKMIVSRGLSRGHKGFRLFNRPEVVVVTFK